MLDAVGPSARVTAWLVATVATVGSLYYSEIANFVPCRLCWYQRIGMYPLAVILLFGYRAAFTWARTGFGGESLTRRLGRSCAFPGAVTSDG